MTDIWKIAKSIETEGIKMYEKLASTSPTLQLAGVFGTLAKEEKRHYELFSQMEKNSSLGAMPALPDDDAVIAEIFGRISAELDNDHDEDAALHDAQEAYSRALSMENKSVEYYQSILDTVKDVSQNSALIWILQEEKRHAKIVEGLVEFVRRPKEWLENAEINHHEVY